MYFDALKLWPIIAKSNVLHFAPELQLQRRIEELCPRSYIKADLRPSSPDIQSIDVTEMPFPDKFFDLVICNHVLEHVQNDTEALSEIFRVIKPGGLAILQTPYSSLLKNSFSDPAICTDELRNHFYGKEDHIRVFGYDLFLKIEQAGFELQVKSHKEVISYIDSSIYGINPNEDLILVNKPFSRAE